MSDVTSVSQLAQSSVVVAVVLSVSSSKKKRKTDKSDGVWKSFTKLPRFYFKICVCSPFLSNNNNLVLT